MKNIVDLIGKSADLVAEEDSVLRRQVSQCVPSEMMQNVIFLREEGKRLRVTVSSAGWASRLRFYSETILRSLAVSGITLNDVSVHVQPQQNMAHLQRKSVRKPSPVSAATVAHIHQVAAGIDDPTLRASMIKLAQSMKRSVGTSEEES